ncbi:MAG: DUF1015 domain-containing protein [Clostridiales bacterium]|nr:MAG: DUF1015 domain-containing protein [Clostridiales bacterium]
MKTFTPADILLPKNVDYTKWSVVACDQFTSDKQYWKDVESLVGDAPSTLKITLPEVYLDDGDTQKRINDVNTEMKNYLDTGIFEEYEDSFIYIERLFSDGKTRHGLVGKLDLEDYSFVVGEESLVRATEGTVLERIPPRVKIRENAPLELPHVMILIDDDNDSVMEAAREGLSKTIYDFDMMKNGGHIKGSLINNDSKDKVLAALDKLACQDVFDEKYGVSGKKPLVFAVGDGNHSLATAKTCKSRYALVELVNLHDKSLVFEPIHRVVFNTNPEKMLSALCEYYKSELITLDTKVDEKAAQTFVTLYGDKKLYVNIKNPVKNLAVGTLQDFLDYYLKTNTGKIDYIHGDDVVLHHVQESSDNIGFLLPVMDKSELFKTVIFDGVLPRKTFSMGHAWEKRYYLEARKI